MIINIDMILGYDFIEERLFSSWGVLSKQLKDPTARAYVKSVRDEQARILRDRLNSARESRLKDVKQVLENPRLSKKDKKFILGSKEGLFNSAIDNIYASGALRDSIKNNRSANKNIYRKQLDLYRKLADQEADKAFKLAKLV